MSYILIDKNNILNKENYANSIFFKYVQYFSLYTQSLINPDDISLIQKAIALFEECWDSFKSEEIKNYKHDIKSKQSLLFSLLGKLDDALAYNDIALKYNPTDEYYIKNRALFYIQKNNHGDALNLLLQITDYKKHIDVPNLLAICYYMLENDDKAIEIINKYLETAEKNEITKNIIGLLIDIYLINKKYQEAKDVIDKYFDDYSDSIEFSIIKSSVYFYNNEPQTAKQLIDKSIVSLDKNKTVKNLNNIALALEQQNRTAEAIKYYEEINPDYTKNPHNTHIANLYLRINRGDKSLEIYKTLRDKFGIDKNITINEISLLERIGDTPKARDLAIKYIDKFPDELKLKISLAGYNHLLGYKLDNRNFLIENIDYLSLDINYLRTYIRLLFDYKFYDKARVCLYEVFRKNKNAIYNDLYIYSHFQFPINEDDKEFKVENVDLHCFVKIKPENTDNNVIEILLEDRQSNELQDIEKNKTNAWFKKLVGKKIGDRILINDRLIEEYGIIVEIKHKYLYALTKALENVNTLYKGVSSFTQFSTSNIDEVLASEEKRYKENELTNQKFYNEYKKRNYPISFFSKLNNVSPVRIWYNFSSHINIVFSRGEVNEFKEELISFSNTYKNNLLFLDIYSLLTFYNLKNRDKLLAVFKFAIAQSTFDIIEDFIMEFKINADKDTLTLVFENNEKHKIDEPAKEKLKTLDYFEKFKIWIHDSIDIQTNPILLRENHPRQEELLQIFDKSIYETFVLAKNNNSIPIVDDYVSRFVLGKELNLNSFSLFTISYFLKDKSKISENEFENEIVNLINLNYSFVPFTVNTLLNSIKQSNFENTFPFTKVVKMLCGDVSSGHSINIGIQFLMEVLKNDFEQKEVICNEVIEKIFYSRDLENTKDLFVKFLNTFDKTTEFDIINTCLTNFLKKV